MAKTTVPGLYIADGAITAAKLSSTLDLSGVTITVATASTGDSDTSVASTAFVQQEIAALVDSSPSALNTLNELAAAIGDDASFSTTVTNSIATKLPLAGGTLTGNLIINTTGSIQIPVGTTAQRPTAAQGQLRFNTTTSKPEIYSGSAWTDVGGGVESVNSATGVVVLTTANIAENTNLYYTDARADARIAAADTDDLSEGSTNLYFTTARANSAFDGRLSGSTGVTVSNGAVSIGQDVATSTSPTFQNLTLSGTNSIKVPSGTTAQRSGSPANGMLRYNSSTNEFEGYADSAWGAIGGDTTSSVDLYTATGNGSTATYDTGKNPQSENNTWVFVGGVYQPKSTYSFSGTQITLSENLPNGEDLEVITGTVSTYNPTDAILGQYNVTTSNTASYDTSLTTENENNVFVFVDGVYQPKSSYTYSGSTLTLDAVPTSGMSLEVLVTRSMNAATVTTGFLADDAVTTVKILDANVTAGKLASSLDLTGKTVTVATASTGDNDTSVASTAFVRQEITALVDSAPAAMDTLNELAAALGDDANFSTTVNASIAAKLPLAGGTMTGALNMGSQNITNAGNIESTGAAAVVKAPHIQPTNAGIATYTGTTPTFHSPSSGEAAFSMNGGERMRIDSSGNVGIGTTAPDAVLTTINSGALTLDSNDGDHSGFGLLIEPSTITANTVNSAIGFARSSGRKYAAIGMQTYSDTDQNGLNFYVQSTASGSAGQLTEAMRITNAGNVGIGTASPQAHLDINTEAAEATTVIINGEINQDKILKFRHHANSEGAGGGYAGFIGSVIDNVLTLGHYNSSGTEVQALHIDEAGNVGIGAPSPTEKLEVDGGVKISNNNSRLYFGTEGGTSYRALEGSTSGSLLQVGEGYTDIALQGNVAIGVTGPSSALTVKGALSIRNSTQNFNGGLSSEVNSGVINFGVNEGSGNRFGGSYTQANQGGFMHFDTRAGQPLFEIYGRTAGVANASGTAILQIESDGTTTFPGTINGFGLKAFGTSSLLISEDGSIGSVSSSNYNTGFGHSVFNSITTGDYNTATGFGAMGSAAVAGEGNTGMGMYALRYITSGSGNVGIGWDSALNLNSGTNNVAVGKLSLKTNQTGGENVAIGTQALQNFTESYNTAVGYRAMISCTSGERNTAIGYDTMVDLQTGESNTAVGYNALKIFTGSDNTAVGRNALDANISGANCTAIGESALTTNTASHQTAVGKGAGQSLSTGSENVVVGHEAGRDGNFAASTLIGRRAGAINTGNGNTYIGHESGTLMTSGAYNLILGRHTGNQHGLDIRTTSNNIVVSDGEGYVGFHNVVNQDSVFGHVDVTRNASSGNSILVGGSATVSLFNGTNSFSGIFLINDFTRTGKVCLVMTGGGEISIIHQTGSDFVLSSSPSSSQYGLYLTSLGIKLKNGTNVAFSCRILGLRTRNQQ